MDRHAGEARDFARAPGEDADVVKALADPQASRHRSSERRLDLPMQALGRHAEASQSLGEGIDDELGPGDRDPVEDVLDSRDGAEDLSGRSGLLLEGKCRQEQAPLMNHPSG